MFSLESRRDRLGLMRFSAYILIIFTLLGSWAFAAQGVVDRKTPFLKHQNETKRIDEVRESAKDKWLIERVELEEKRKRDQAEFLKKRRKMPTVSDDFGPEIRDWHKKRSREFEIYEEARRIYSKTIPKKELSNLSEMQEFDLFEKGERFDYRKRALYGGKPSYSKNTSSPGSFDSGGSSSSGGGGYVPRPSDYNSNPYTPPPSGGDADYQSGDDFLPPPPPPEGFENDIPPPPPFIPEDSNDGFIPPPPPPPFEDEPPPPVY